MSDLSFTDVAAFFVAGFFLAGFLHFVLTYDREPICPECLRRMEFRWDYGADWCPYCVSQLEEASDERG
jgi:predicted amidophosphoribosyltransferase